MYEEYKALNEKWVKQIPQHWDVLRLKRIFWERKERNAPIKTNFILSLTCSQGVVPVAEKEGAGGNKPKDDLSLYNIAYENDLLVNCMNVVSGAAGVSKWKGAISPVYYALVPRSEQYNVWYYHYIFRLFSFQRSLLGLGKGILMHESDSGKLNTVRMRISMSYLNNVLLPIPPKEEQDKIVDYLNWQVSNINSLLKKKRKEISYIQEIRQKIIKEAITKGIHKTELKDSGISWIGDIPTNWDVIRIKWLFSETEGRNVDGTADLLTFSKNRGLIKFSDATDKLPSAEDLTNYKLIKPGQLLENRMQAWHGMFICADKSGCVSPDYSVFEKNKDRYVNVKFYEYVFRNPVWVQQFANASKGVGSGFNRLYTPQFGAIYTVYPPQEEQDEIVEYIQKRCELLDATIEKLNKEISLIEEYRTSLISDVVCGKIDVRDIMIPEFEYIEDSFDEDADEDETIEEE